MESEKIESTYFYRAIKELYPNNSLFSQIESTCWILCVPQSSSINFSVTKSDIFNHIIIRLPNGMYQTHSRKNLEIKNKYIITSNDFPINRTIRIIYELPLQLPYNHTQDQSIKVLYISSPLIGGIEAPSLIEDIDVTSLNRYMGILYTFHENSNIINSLSDFTSDILMLHKQHGCILPYIDDLPKLIKDQCDYFVDLFMRTSLIQSVLTRDYNPKKMLCVVVENYILIRIFDVLYKEIIHDKQDELDQYSDNIRKIYRDQFRQTTQYDEKYGFGKANSYLDQLRNQRTPLEKIKILLHTLEEIQAAIESYISNHNDEQLNIRNMDEFLDLECKKMIKYLLLIKFPETQFIIADLEYIKNYHYPQIDPRRIANAIFYFQKSVDSILDNIDLDPKPKTVGSSSYKFIHSLIYDENRNLDTIKLSYNDDPDKVCPDILEQTKDIFDLNSSYPSESYTSTSSYHNSTYQMRHGAKLSTSRSTSKTSHDGDSEAVEFRSIGKSSDKDSRDGSGSASHIIHYRQVDHLNNPDNVGINLDLTDKSTDSDKVQNMGRYSHISVSSASP